MSSRTFSYIALHARYSLWAKYLQCQKNFIYIKLFYYFFRSFSSILTYIRRHKLIKFCAGFLLCVLFFRLTKPNYFSYGISYAKIIYDLVNTDMQRQNNVIEQDAQVFVMFLLMNMNSNLLIIRQPCQVSLCNNCLNAFSIVSLGFASFSKRIHVAMVQGRDHSQLSHGNTILFCSVSKTIGNFTTVVYQTMHAWCMALLTPLS